MPEFLVKEKNGDTLYSMSGDGASFSMDTPEYGGFVFNAEPGLQVTSMFAQFGDFSEALALRERRKPHTSEDERELSLETANPIPFGAEPRVERIFKFDGKSLAVSTTFVLRHSFQMRSIFAGGLKFTGALARVAVQEIPDHAGPAPKHASLVWQDVSAMADGTVLFDADRPPLRFLAGTPTGESVEFEIGENIWRWVNAKRISGTCRYTITKKENAFEFAWQLYSFVPENAEAVPPDGRDWRIRYRLIRHAAKAPRNHGEASCKAVFDAAAFPFPDSSIVPDCDEKHACLSAAPTLNALKKWVRKMLANAEKGDVFGIKNMPAFICCSAAHMDRAKLKDLIHWDGPAMDDFVRWANRQMARSGAELVILKSK